jgi:hypothetical protein
MNHNETGNIEVLLAISSMLVSFLAYYPIMNTQRHVPLKRLLTFNGLYDVISQKRDLSGQPMFRRDLKGAPSEYKQNTWPLDPTCSVCNKQKIV